MPGFTPLLPPRPVADGTNEPIRVPTTPPPISAMIRDNMTLSSWLLLGALLQAIAIYTLGPLTALPAAAIITYRTLDHLLMACKLTRNRYMDGVLRTKVSGQYPRPDGSFEGTPAAESIVVFRLGARSNHPLGVLAPGMRALGKYVREMAQDMTGDAEKYGVLGLERWGKLQDPAGNETMYLFYLRDYDGLHRFAHDKLHMDGLAWWTTIVKDHPHISILHETYVVPRGQWENIYINSKPTGMGNTWFPSRDEDGGVRELVHSAVDARSGALRSASKRLQFKWLEEVEKEQGELYDRTFI
ncbi:hypothetical protein ASPCAL14328 [Aspergillus calidoustus]|uniref:Uncharacterized protein n=1 Tax=Aspergillus calidoustus TaxID=454130 RepID=A0A0U5CJR9_ASPCI|nr:hypothetical protein ASPCAL14328 [Aspergillus calidoustus]